MKSSLSKEKDEKIAKLSTSVKELKSSLSSREQACWPLVEKHLCQCPWVTFGRVRARGGWGSGAPALPPYVRLQEVANLKKQLGSAQRVEEDLRKQHASAANAVQKEEKHKVDALAKLKGSIEQVLPT